MKHYLWLLVLIPMTTTYGAMYSAQQHWNYGWLSHEDNATHHLTAALWAIFPPMWIVAPIFTDGYADGFQFRHHHTRFCLTGEDLTNQSENKCELDPECDPVLRDATCPDRDKSKEPQ